MQQLLWLETLLKLFSGSMLAIAPMATIRLLGLPRPDGGFWPRICGALLIGMAAALFLEGAAGHGLALSGMVIINLCGAAMLAAMLGLDRGPSSARGRIAVWITVCLMVILSVLEIAVL